MTSTFNSISENNLKIVADFIFDLLNKSYKNLILEAEVGVGKTTFINYFLLNYFNIKSNGSPTFSIINQYKNNNTTINHIDLYRIKDFDSYILEEIDNADYNFIE
jgi:tRNA threonylcarbamoyladenosine biosynthesis protein TsaE